MKDNDKISESINWSRSIIVNELIDNDLVRKLTPSILSLRQENNNPITIGIDSSGGSLASLDNLLGLLTGPTQDRKFGEIITVATNRAYSAAASFLAFGSYAVALRHSEILYHDVRIGGMEDVTPEKAQAAAKTLQNLNDSFALRLANEVIRRLVWNYIGLKSDFEAINKNFPKTYKEYSKIIDTFVPKVEGQHSVDLASFATCLYARLSISNDNLITKVMNRLERWITLTKLVEATPTYRKKGTRVPGLLDGAKYLHKIIPSDRNAEQLEQLFESSEQDLKLVIGLLVSAIVKSNLRVGSDFSPILERATRDFILIQSMNDKKHQLSVNKLMLNYDFTFFGREIAEELKGKNEEEQSTILSTAAPHARLFWYLCVLLCRELFEGEHVLTPSEAQLLGLVDEVAGGGPIQSRREWKLSLDKAKQDGKVTG